jgi:LuxR family maltose regulon positive regulatory protein
MEAQSADADPAMAAAAVLFEAWILLSAGRAAEAQQTLLMAPELEGALPAQVTLARTLTLADIETQLGRPNAALRLLDAGVLDPKDPARTVCAAHAFLALGDGEAAQRGLRPALISAESPVSLPLLVSVLLASAQAAELLGDEAKAVEEVLRAADLATDAIIQPFVGARAGLAGLLARHPEAYAAWPKIPNSPASPPPLSSVIPSQLAEPLTEREGVVLRRLATTMTNAEIAEELCVSINTVKTHVAAIYRKLPAAGRRDAVARARHLELM